MKYSEKELDALALDSFEELTYKIKYHITEGFAFSRPQEKYRDFLIKTLGASVYNKIREKFFCEKYRSELIDSYEKRGLECITCFSEFYPPQFLSIPAPPLVLYCKGNVGLLKERAFAVVGSRRTPTETLKRCAEISGQLAEKFAVVTGTAEGADTAAASGALETGRIICVAAQGLDRVYPASNQRLYKKVAQKGLLLSEQLPGTPAKAYLFPVRNRIIAALAEGVLVVSAGEKSGASITAEYAFEYGKDVFCFPYSIGIAAGAGCNRLIKKGAYLAENILDIFAAFGLDFTARRAEELTARESEVLKTVRDIGKAHISEIASALGCAPYELLSELSSLEVKNLVVRLGGNRYGAL